MIKSNLRNSGFDFAKKRGKEAAVISRLESYLILKIKALGHWVASHDEYYSSQVCPRCFGILKPVPPIQEGSLPFLCVSEGREAPSLQVCLILFLFRCHCISNHFVI